MNFKSLFFCLLALTAFSIVGCDNEEDCTTTCAANEELTANCTCIQVSCPNTCAADEIQLADCSCQAIAEACDGVTCPENFACDNGTCVQTDNFERSGTLSADETWEAGKTYILKDRVTVPDGITLTIEAGVIVKGEAGTGANASALLIARGGTLNAMGTASAPIIMTSVADEIAAGQIASPNLSPDVTGLWGGLIILGNAPISASNDDDPNNVVQLAELQIEGIPTSDSNGLYGGNDAADNSGTITYVSVRHGGTNIGEGNEINGITFGGVGSGTTINNLEVVGTQDDGLEFFGGTVSVTNALVWNNGDDAFDTDQAWAGTLDNAISINPGDSPLELDGPEGSYTSTGHTITNLTSYGAGAGKELFDVDASTDINMSNLFFFGFAADSDISSDYPAYAANTNGYAVTGIEAIFTNGGDAASVFGDAASLVTTRTMISAVTGGADASAFSWTWAGQGALADLGL